jgi:hypothetical protein
VTEHVRYVELMRRVVNADDAARARGRMDRALIFGQRIVKR